MAGKQLEKADRAMEKYKEMVTTAASLAASAMLIRSVANDLLPHELREFVFSGLRALQAMLGRNAERNTIVIEETEGYAANQVYVAARTYLATKISADMHRLKVSRVDESKSMLVSIEAGEELVDVFDGTRFTWQLVGREKSNKSNDGGGGASQEVTIYELSFDKKDSEKAMSAYLPHVLATAKAIDDQQRVLKLHMNEYECWSPIDLHHPSTFDTLAMDPELKRTIMDDLTRFLKRKDYYRRTGRAWKRGYLLYGPPGTGKSSLVAAMANFLKFDIYDLELTEVGCNTSLRRLLIGMSNKSILVIEDIDCTVNLQHREEEAAKEGDENGPPPASDDRVTLSGLLNFIDGLWSTSGEERIIVFTTNYKERLDPALLRPGRMDMHIHMGYCCFKAFRVLASNYHAVDSHSVFPEIEKLIAAVEVTPAEMAEVLMRQDDTDDAMRGVVEFLQEKKDAKDKKPEEPAASAAAATEEAIAGDDKSDVESQ